LLLGMLATMAVGVFIFHENLNLMQIVGVVLAFAALILLNF
jgi:multidrug transporter EmrE-like cation transporter